MGKINIEGLGTFTVDNSFGELPEDVQQSYVNELRQRYAAKGIAQEMQQPDYGKMSAKDVAKSAVSNIPSSAVEFGKAMAQPFVDPMGTAENIGKIGKGVLQKLGIMEGKDAEPYAEAVGKFVMERYGSAAALKKTIATDPVGLAADLSTVLTGGGSLAARAPGVIGRVGEIAGTVGRAVDPLLAAKPIVKGAGAIAAQGLGITTGAGGDAIKTAARAGAEGGEAGRAFRQSLLGETAPDSIVAEAKGAVAQMRFERGQEYRAEMAKLGTDKNVLNFSDVDNAVNNTVKKFKGVSISPSVERIQGEIRQAVNDWKALPPADFHTAEGFDALKQRIGDIRDSTQFNTPERVAADKVYNAVRGTIVSQVPEYAKIMKGYEEASTQIKEIERTLSLNPKASVDTQLRKLLSSLRDNVNTNYGKRKELVAFLARSGATHLLEKIAGQTLKSGAPRGLGRLAATGEGAGALMALGMGHPGAAAAIVPALAASSPLLAGGAAYGAGAASRIARPLGRGLFQAGRLSDVQ